MANQCEYCQSCICILLVPVLTSGVVYGHGIYPQSASTVSQSGTLLAETNGHE